MNFFDSFTKGAKRVLEIAQEEAHRLGHNYVGTEHLLLGCIRERTSVSGLLGQMGVNFESVCRQIDELIGKGDHQFTAAFGYTPRTKHVLVVGREEAAALGKRQIPGSVAFVPGTAGLILAGEVVKDIAKTEK